MSTAIIPFVWKYDCIEAPVIDVDWSNIFNGGEIVIPYNIRVQNGVLYDWEAVDVPSFGTLQKTGTGWYYTPNPNVVALNPHPISISIPISIPKDITNPFDNRDIQSRGTIPTIVPTTTTAPTIKILDTINYSLLYYGVKAITPPMPIKLIIPTPLPPTAITARSSIASGYVGQSYVINWKTIMAPAGSVIQIYTTAHPLGSIVPLDINNQYDGVLSTTSNPIILTPLSIFPCYVTLIDVKGKVLALAPIYITILATPPLTLTTSTDTIYPGDTYDVLWTTSTPPIGGYVLMDNITTQRLTTDSDTHTIPSNTNPGSFITYTAHLYTADGILLVSKSITIKVSVWPVITLSATPTLIFPGNDITFKWDTINPPISGYVNIMGTNTNQPYSGSSVVRTKLSDKAGTIYSFTVYLYGNVPNRRIATASISVVIVKQPILTATSNLTIYPGESYVVSWITTDSIDGMYTNISGGDPLSSNQPTTLYELLPTDNKVYMPSLPIHIGTIYTHIIKLYDSTGAFVTDDCVSITVIERPIVTIIAPDVVYHGYQFVVYWLTTNLAHGLTVNLYANNCVPIGTQAYFPTTTIVPTTTSAPGITASTSHFYYSTNTIGLPTEGQLHVDPKQTDTIGLQYGFFIDVVDVSGHIVATASKIVTLVATPSITLKSTASNYTYVYNTVYPGDSYTISWSTANTAPDMSVLISGVSDPQPLSGSLTFPTNPTDVAGTTYPIDATVVGFLHYPSVTSTPTPTIPAATITITSDKLSVYSGQSYNIGWAATPVIPNSYVQLICPPIDPSGIPNIITHQLPTDNKTYTPVNSDPIGFEYTYIAELYDPNGVYLAQKKVNVMLVLPPTTTPVPTTTVVPTTTPVPTTTTPPIARFVVSSDKLTINPGETFHISWTVDPTTPSTDYVILYTITSGNNPIQVISSNLPATGVFAINSISSDPIGTTYMVIAYLYDQNNNTINSMNITITVS